MGGGVTVWQGTALEQCNHEQAITLRHSQFHVPGKNNGSCVNEAIFARAIEVINNTYVSELNVTVNPEMSNKTVQCVHDYNITETTVKRITIMFISESDVSQNLHPTDAQLSNVSIGELMFSWNPKIKRCSSSSLSFHFY